MAASGSTPISLYYSSTSGHVPLYTNLVFGELAVNIADGKLFYRDPANNVQVLAGAGGSGVVAGSNTQIQFNNSGVFGASSSLTWDGTYFTAASIKDSALTSGRVTYAGTSGLLQDSANLTFNGTTLTANTLNLTNALVTTYGGTGLASYTAGDLLYYSTGTTLSKLAIGTNNYVLTSNGSAPQWVAASTITVGAAGSNTQIQYNNSGVLGAVSTFVYTSTGLGVGVTTPLGKLHVVGGNSNNAIIDNNGEQYTTLSWYNNGVEKAQTYWDQTNTLLVSGTDVSAAYVLKTNATERMRIEAAGNVGIGTIAPLDKLHVAGTGTPGIRIQDADGTNQYGVFGQDNGATTFTSRNAAANGTFVWNQYNGTTTTQVLSIDASGNSLHNNNTIQQIKTATFNSQTTIATTSGSITVDWTTAQNQLQTEPTGTITYTFTAPPGPCHLQLIIGSDGTSTAQTINWPGTVAWMGSTWAGANNKKAVINFWYDGSNYIAVGTNQV